MKIIIAIIAIIAIVIIIDIYLRLKRHTRFISFLMMANDVINKTLANKGIIKREEVDKARKEVLENLKKVSPKDYEKYKKSLLEMGIDIEK